MIDNKSICLAYETVEKEDHSLPLLIPMSEVAGRMSIQEGARFLEKPQGGKGILLGGVPGVKPAKVLILGGGIVGSNAAQMAAGMGADVTVADINLSRLRYLSETLPKNVKTLYASELRIKKELPDVDLVIGSVLIPGIKRSSDYPKYACNDAARYGTCGCSNRSGGCFETSHPRPQCAYLCDRRYRSLCRSQYPGSCTLYFYAGFDQCYSPYVIALANKGWKKLVKNDPALSTRFRM